MAIAATQFHTPRACCDPSPITITSLRATARLGIGLAVLPANKQPNTEPMNIRAASFALLILISLGGAKTSAAELNQAFTNDFQTNAVYLWSTDPLNMTFDGVSFGTNMPAWHAALHTPARLVLSGPTIGAAAGSFNLVMNYKNTPFKLEWAEVFFDNTINVVRGYGTLTYNGSGWSNADVATHLIDIPLHANSAATPIPSSVLLMLSALALVPLQRLGLRRAVPG